MARWPTAALPMLLDASQYDCGPAIVLSLLQVKTPMSEKAAALPIQANKAAPLNAVLKMNAVMAMRTVFDRRKCLSFLNATLRQCVPISNWRCLLLASCMQQSFMLPHHSSLLIFFVTNQGLHKHVS